ncbi:MAG: 50S ribosomal protein L25/general stress protein Ctc [Verrucomicrobia bacterium]|nr:50S ribosomal protein L25/general stress protein Ctc [Verrucomicrobiota bacterium]
MKLTVKSREGEKKGDIKQIRREGNIPAIIYSSSTKPEKMIVDGTEFAAILRGVLPGQLPTTIFTLTNGKKERKAIIKDIQYHLTTYKVSHIDFEELLDEVPVSVKVPVNCTGVVDCVGIKLGGFLRQVTRHVKVECLPKNIPAEFLIDVRDLGIRQSKRLKDIAMPQGVRPLASTDEVIVVIAKR